MERLTKNDMNKAWYDPWELCGMDRHCTKGCHEEGGCTRGCHILKMYQKLADYEDLEEQGKLLILPCAVGDTVYRAHKGNDLSPTRIYECNVVGIKQEYNTVSIKLHANINEETYSIWVDDWFDKCQIGYEFFLTENEALRKINEIESENVNTDK